MWQLYLLILAAIYLAPILSIIFYPLKRYIEFGWEHYLFGHLEWALSFFRDIALAGLMVVFLIHRLVLFLGYKESFPLWYLALLVFIGISVWNFFHRRRRVRALIDRVVNDPIPEPKEFYRLYYASISLLPGHLPISLRTKLKLPLNYAKGKGRLSYWPILPGVMNTASAARLVLRARKWKGADYCSKFADKISAIWGARLVSLTRANFDVKGIENLAAVNGRAIFVSNHKSYIDFVLLPIILGLVNQNRDATFRPKYMAARDHFYDNPFLYWVLGIGRALDALGTVFVDRRSKKERSTKAVDHAVQAIVEEGVDIMIYPQGTRAFGNTDANGQRLDGGYYTTGSIEQLSHDRGHLRKGAAYLAVDSARLLAPQNILLNIVPIGLIGTGLVVPRGEVRLQKSVSIKAVIGRPIVLSVDEIGEINRYSVDSEVYGAVRKRLVDSVHIRIDEVFKKLLNINGELTKRLLVDIRRVMSEDEINKFLESIEAWRTDEDLIFSVIDCIYSLPAKQWASNLRRFHQLLGDTSMSRENILAFKKNVVSEITRNK